MKLSNQERETHCLFNEAEADMEIYTHNPTMQKRLMELCKVHPTQVHFIQKNGFGGMTFHLPKKWLRIVPPRILTPAQREVLDRMNATKRKIKNSL